MDFDLLNTEEASRLIRLHKRNGFLQAMIKIGSGEPAPAWRNKFEASGGACKQPTKSRRSGYIAQLALPTFPKRPTRHPKRASPATIIPQVSGSGMGE